MPTLQSSKHKPLYDKNNNNYFNLQIIHHRYILDGDRPSQTTKYTMFYLKIINFENYLRWYYTVIYKIIKIIKIKNYHLCYIKYNQK